MLILVTGANGQVGQCLQEVYEDIWPEAKFLFTDVDDLDITDSNAVQAFFKKHNPTWCLNLAAYTAVDKAEDYEDLCMAINVSGARNLAEAAQAHGAKMFHFSSDYVYHSTENAPMKEDSPTTPKGVYARTKLLGDQAVLEACERSIILRTSWVYAPMSRNFVKTILRLSSDPNRDRLTIVYDQIGAPTYAPDIVDAMLFMCKKVEKGEVNNHDAFGIFNYANEGVTSWYDFAVNILELFQIDCEVEPIRSEEYPTPAQRPTYSVLDKTKIKKVYGLKIPHWNDALRRCIERLKVTAA